MNPLLLAALALGGYYLYTQSSKQSAAESGGTIPPSTPSTTPSSSFTTFDAAALAKLKAAPVGTAKQYSFNGSTVTVTQHSVSTRDDFVGEYLPQYKGLTTAGLAPHYMIVADSVALQSVLSATAATCSIWIIAGATTAACAAMFNFMKSSNPNLTIVSP